MPNLCSVQGCERPFRTRRMCNKHYKQVLRHGRLKPESEWYSNQFSVSNGMCYITLKDHYVAIVDESDSLYISRFKWYSVKNKRTRYVYRVVNGKKVFLHRELLDAKTIVDHVNGNGLDNRRCNIRECTYQENSYNRCARLNTSSQYKGVQYHKAARKWVASIKANQVSYYLGLYTDEYEAACAYNVACSLLHGSFARLNKL